VATPYSIGKQLEKGATGKHSCNRVVKRGLILVLFRVYIITGWKLSLWRKLEFGSVLGRIGLAYMFALIIIYL